MHRLEVQLALDAAMADLEAERIKSMPPALEGYIHGFASRDKPDTPRPDGYRSYMVVGFDPSLHEAIIQFSADLSAIITEHGHDSLRWRRAPKLTRVVDAGCGDHWKVTARLIAALTPEAASQLP